MDGDLRARVISATVLLGSAYAVGVSSGQTYESGFSTQGLFDLGISALSGLAVVGGVAAYNYKPISLRDRVGVPLVLGTIFGATAMSLATILGYATTRFL